MHVFAHRKYLIVDILKENVITVAKFRNVTTDFQLKLADGAIFLEINEFVICVKLKLEMNTIIS